MIYCLTLNGRYCLDHKKMAKLFWLSALQSSGAMIFGQIGHALACTELANLNALKSSSTLSYRQSGAAFCSALSSRQIGDVPSWEISINFRVVV